MQEWSERGWGSGRQVGRGVSGGLVLVYLKGTGPRICWKTCCGGREEKALGDTKTWTLRNWNVPTGVGGGEGDQAGAL